ncbi:MAG: hypothetical protein P8Z79_07670 [Sedimentisphaerales bacterium]|jgi:hypothetical protein
MNDEEVRKIIEDTYDEPRENTIWSMVGDFYNRKMLSIVIFTWAWGMLLVAGAIYSAVRFFGDIGTKSQIMYVAIFLVCCQFLVLVKIFAWQLIHRNGLRREIKRLELRIAELNESVVAK